MILQKVFLLIFVPWILRLKSNIFTGSQCCKQHLFVYNKREASKATHRNTVQLLLSNGHQSTFLGLLWIIFCLRTLAVCFRNFRSNFSARFSQYCYSKTRASSLLMMSGCSSRRIVTVDEERRLWNTTSSKITMSNSWQWSEQWCWRRIVQ